MLGLFLVDIWSVGCCQARIAPMDQDKRSDKDQSRRLMLQELTDAQRAAINQLEGFGWYLTFVRRPLFQNVVPILHDEDSGRYAVLEKDGTLNEDHELITRP